MKLIIFIVLFIVLSFNCVAQDSTRAFHFSLGTTFTTVPTVSIKGIDTIYNNSLSIAPSIDIRNTNGLGVSYSPKFVTGNSASGIYVHEITAGLQRYNKVLFDVVADYSHYFFTNNKSVPSTPITNELYFSGTYKKPWLMPTLFLGYGFGTEKIGQQSNSVSDVNLSAGISHLFQKDISDDASFSLSPSLKLNAGTNQYFSLLRSSKYISASKNYHNVVKKKKGNGNGYVVVTNTPVARKGFSLSNAEAELQGSFEKGSFNIQPSVNAIFPFSTSDNAVSFLWQIDLRYSF